MLLIITAICSVNAQLCEGSLGDPIVNIDFGSGTATHGSPLGSDITSYSWTTADFPQDGYYTIESTTNTPNTWWTTTDHTGGGYMMVVNASFSITDYFYKKTVTGLCPNTTYEFAVWIMNLLRSTDNSLPNITLTIEQEDGTILNSYNTGDIPLQSSAVWKQYGFYFTTPANIETVVIRMRNNKVGAAPGNDIALDDITFRPCGPTVTTAVEDESSATLTVCENETVNYTLQGTVSSGYTNPMYQWQSSTDEGSTWIDIPGATAIDYTFTVSSTPGTYMYRLAVADDGNIETAACRIVSEIITIEVLETPMVLTGETEQEFCTTQQPTVSDLEVNGSAVWYDSLEGGNQLLDTTSLVSGATYYAAQETVNGCESDERLGITVTIVSPTLAVFDVSDIFCDELNNGEETINITTYEAEMATCTDCIFTYFTSLEGAENASGDSQISSPEVYELTSEDETVFVRIDSYDQCYQVAQLNLQLQSTPETPLEETMVLCEDATLTLDAGSGFYDYLWSTGETSSSIMVSEIGTYSVTITQELGDIFCSSTLDIDVVLGNAPNIQNIVIDDWSDSQNSITINLTDSSIGNYEYSIDGFIFQDSNVFTDLPSGEYTVYVQEKNGCGNASEVVYLLYYRKFFTPNGDTYNDTWSIEFTDEEPTLTTKIYDRYGKLLAHLGADDAWDGTFNGRMMPSNDYWFVVTRANGKTHTGHFTLKR
ncbi:T9SS type B sorting domain-containing protein [Mangrovimonas xylaniphaga]|uniref:T9SS type B sorting domain-containing protein n=1 Tax=Mangrovimonas xylaniphaga TaxID=1645915 RepID=UPI000AF228E8|nr:T9SS type B sorting domain-containing protein [Mangrovimonas xylaniphaga]